MRFFLSSLLLAFIFISCESSTDSGTTSELRIIGEQFALGMTHNSHLGRSTSNPETSYSATISFEFFLHELSNAEEIIAFQIIDDEGEGWDFNSTEVANAYNTDNHSLVFEDLELRIFDNINNELLRAQFLDENGELIREKGFTLDNNFALPAISNVSNLGESSFNIFLDFYDTPYDGGSIPFNITVYNTMYSSNTYILVWADANGTTIREDYLGFGSFADEGSDDWSLSRSIDDIPAGATSFYFTILRGWYTVGGILYTNIEELPGSLQ